MESLLAIWTQEIWSNRKIGKGWFLPQSFFSKIAPVKLLVLFSFPLPARPRTQHCYHYDTKVKPEAATAVIELLMMGRRTPETCWVVNKRQDNKLKNCCIWLVIYLNWKRRIMFTARYEMNIQVQFSLTFISTYFKEQHTVNFCLLFYKTLEFCTNGTCRTAGYTSVSGRPCNRPSRHRFFCFPCV